MAINLDSLESTAKKIPPWGWVAIGGGVLGLLWLRNQQSAASTPAPAQTELPGSTDNPPNTSTPEGPCPPYTPAICSGGMVAILEQDQNGCPISVCSQPGTGPTSGGTQCHSTLHGGTYVVGHTGSLTTLRQIFAHVGQDVNCALQWNPSAAGRATPLDNPLWPGFVVYY